MVNIERNGTVNSGSEPNENLLINSHVHVDTESYNMHQWTYSTPPTDGETYTLQIKGKLGDGKAAWGIYNSGGTGGASSPRVIGTTGNSNYLTPNLYDETTGIYTLKISNSAGYELPSTGGQGTKLFTACGAVMILRSGILFLMRRRCS